MTTARIRKRMQCDGTHQQPRSAAAEAEQRHKHKPRTHRCKPIQLMPKIRMRAEIECVRSFRLPLWMCVCAGAGANSYNYIAVLELARGPAFYRAPRK